MGELISLFQSKNIFTRRDRRLVFLCGGPVSTRRRSFRKRLLHYAQASLHDFRFFLAEDAARDIFAHGYPFFVNIAEFETLISALADCVVVIPESPGSIAELGYFSAHKPIRDKTLVVNDLNFQGDDSFLNLGPIELINRHSNYRPTLHFNLKDKSPNFRAIVKQLRRYELDIRGHFEFKKYGQLPIRHRLFVVFEFIFLFGQISYEALELAISFVFQGGRSLSDKHKRELRQLLSILCAGQYVQRLDHGVLLVPTPDVKPFLDISDSLRNSLRIKISDFATRLSTRVRVPRKARSK